MRSLNASHANSFSESQGAQALDQTSLRHTEPTSSAASSADTHEHQGRSGRLQLGTANSRLAAFIRVDGFAWQLKSTGHWEDVGHQERRKKQKIRLCHGGCRKSCRRRGGQQPGRPVQGHGEEPRPQGYSLGMGGPNTAKLAFV